jgi:hypothetical protein
MKIDISHMGFPPHAAKRNDVLRAVQTLLFTPSKLPVTLEDRHIEALKTAEWFDFGRVDDSDGAVSRAANDAMPFAKEWLVNLPFPVTVFRARIGLHTKPPEHTESGKILTPEDQREVFHSEFIQLLMQPTIGAAIEILSFMMLGWEYDSAMLMTHSIGHGNELRVKAGLGFKEDMAMVEYRMFLSMWLMLNARNMEHRIEEPGDKLNRARAKIGRPPLLRTTYVSAARYAEALTETVRREEGHRASPCMHLRRAHLRHLPGRDRPIPIAAMIINGPKGSEREHYRVI